MIQRFVLVMMGVVLPTGGVAQSLAFGAVTGMSSTQLATPGNYFGRRTGFALGGEVTLELGDRIALRAQALVHEKGSSGSGLFNMRIRYLETPILVTVSAMRRTARLRPHLSVGVAPAKELACGGTMERGYFEVPPRPPVPVPLDCSTERTDLWDVGVVGAGGIELRVARLRIGVELRYTKGTHNIASGYAPLGFPVKNSATSLLVTTALGTP